MIEITANITANLDGNDPRSKCDAGNSLRIITRRGHDAGRMRTVVSSRLILAGAWIIILCVIIGAGKIPAVPVVNIAIAIVVDSVGFLRVAVGINSNLSLIEING